MLHEEQCLQLLLWDVRQDSSHVTSISINENVQLGHLLYSSMSLVNPPSWLSSHCCGLSKFVSENNFHGKKEQAWHHISPLCFGHWNSPDGQVIKRMIVLLRKTRGFSCWCMSGWPVILWLQLKFFFPNKAKLLCDPVQSLFPSPFLSAFL